MLQQRQLELLQQQQLAGENDGQPLPCQILAALLLVFPASKIFPIPLMCLAPAPGLPNSHVPQWGWWLVSQQCQLHRHEKVVVVAVMLLCSKICNKNWLAYNLPSVDRLTLQTVKKATKSPKPKKRPNLLRSQPVYEFDIAYFGRQQGQVSTIPFHI